MKKLLVFLILLIVPVFVYADTVDYDITNYYIDADILENGDLRVKELIVLDGSFNGYEREIAYTNSKLIHHNPVDLEHDAIYNAEGITDYKAYAKHVKNVSWDTFDANFDELDVVLNMSAAKSGDVYIRDDYNQKVFRMYYKTSHQKTAFLITYTLENAVVLHDDVAELYWQFIGYDYTDVIKDLKIRVNLPDEDTSDDFKVWSHVDIKKGYNDEDLIGEIHKKNDRYALATTKRVNKNTPVDVRMTFSKDLITDTSKVKKSNIDALDGILEVEKKRADEANAIREKYKRLDMISRVVSAISIVFQLISIIYIYFRYDREYKSDFISDYNREFIDDYSVEVVDYIMNKKITPNAMSASIMNLVYKKNIKVEKLEDEKKEEYKFTFQNFDGATDEEKELIDFLFNRVGNQETFTTKQLKEYAKSTKTYNKFLSNYTRWESKVMKKGKELKIYESHAGVTTYAVLYMCASLFLGFITINLGLLNVMVVLNALLSIGIAIYTGTFDKRTKYGNEQYVRWKAFKKFLLDFGTFELKELPEIALWERYLVYATIFGVAKKVSGAMNVKIKEMNLDQSNISFTDYYLYNNLSYNISNSVSNAMSFARATRAAEISKSSMSSGGGGGGGFSSGGGFGGGGGGGHGF